MTVARVADFLRPLMLFRRRRRHRGDRQADEVAIVRRVPVPVPVGGGGRDAAAADLPVDVERRPAHVLVRPQRAVHVGQPIERVEARRGVAQVGGDLRVLAVRRTQRRGDAGHDLRVALRALPRVIDGERDGELVRRRVEQLAARAEVVQPVGVVAAHDVGGEAVAPRARERHAPGQAPKQPPGDGRAGLHVAVVPGAQLDVALPGEGRLARGHVDRARRGVLAEQGALRAAQHFDPLDVEEVEGRRRRAGIEDPVDVHPDAGLDAVVGEPERRAEAANLDRRVARVGRIERDGRHQLLQPVHVEGAGVLDQLAVHDGDRDRHFLGDFLDATRRHDDALRDPRRPELDVDSRLAVVFDGDLLRRRLEAVERGFDAIGAGREAIGAIGALSVRDHDDGRARRVADDPDGGAGHGAARRVTDDTGDHAARRLGTGRDRRGQQPPQSRRQTRRVHKVDIHRLRRCRMHRSRAACTHAGHSYLPNEQIAGD